jgi:branched-chain amino acid transport system ATP-binding protein
MNTVLEVRDLKKAFGGIHAVDGVSFDVNEGEILGIIGPNGSGKSTLFNCILGQLRPTSGEVSLDGRPVPACAPATSIASASAARSSCCRCFPN